MNDNLHNLVEYSSKFSLYCALIIAIILVSCFFQEFQLIDCLDLVGVSIETTSQMLKVIVSQNLDTLMKFGLHEMETISFSI
jgi:hypothetical protein